MQLLILPRGTNAEELFAAGAKVDSNGKLVLSGFQTAEIPLTTSVLMHAENEKYIQYKLTSALTLLPGDTTAAENDLPNSKNSLPTSRSSNWVTAYLRGDITPSTLKREKHVHFEETDKGSKKKHKEKTAIQTSDSKLEKKRSKSSHKNDKNDKNDTKVKKVKN